MQKKLFLLDAYALIYRSYFAFIKNPRYNSKGLNTSAIYGFTNTLLDVLQNQQPTHIAVVFDPPTPTFRHEMYPLYKAQRQETPEDIRSAVPYIKKIIEAFNIPVIQVDGFEADDVIATLALQAKEKGFVTYMMTPDKDYAQVVQENIYMFKPGRSGNDAEIWGVNEVKQNFQIEDPKQVKEILALMGDASDNIPGAKGIGEKTAIKLISQYHTVENLLEHIHELSGKLKENIIASADDIKLSKILVTIALDVPVKLEEEKLIVEPVNQLLAKEVFDELEFRNLSNRIGNNFTKTENKITASAQLSLFDVPAETVSSTSEKNSIQTVLHQYFLADTFEKCQQLAEMLSKQNEFCFDTETTGLELFTMELVGLSFSWKEHEAWYVPVPEVKEEALALLSIFKPVFEKEEVLKIGQNIKFDIQVLKQYGIEVRGKLFDTMLAHYLIQPEMRHNMDFLAELYLNYVPIPIEKLIGEKGKYQRAMRTVPVELICDYACEDADITFQLKKKFEKELQKFNLQDLFFNIETKLIPVLAEIEIAGVKIDEKALKNYADVLLSEIEKIEKEIIRETGGEYFNISSPQQLGKILYEKLKIIDNPQLTKTKQYSTGEEVLEKLKGSHPVIPKILEYRSLRKLLGTYVEALPQLINPVSGKIHTSYNQAVTATGRLSSNNPNLQNIPIREEKGREIRKAFIPSDSRYVLLSADYSQIELRLMAHMSEDEAMISAFNAQADIHAATAAKIFSVPLDAVTSDMRRKAKTANFGIIYGISAFGLAERLTISRSEAKELIDGYFTSFPGVKKYMNDIIAVARENGYVQTIFGRRRYLKDINSNNATVRGFAERNAINTPIQGSAADIIKKAMIDIYDEMKRLNMKSSMILQVHDELVFDVFKPELEKLKIIVKEKMEQVTVLKVPLLVDMGVGENWLEAH